MASPEFLQSVRDSSERLGINPSDLLTAISYETGGTLSPDIYGGAGRRYLGLIQFSPENQWRYGVKPGMAAHDQMKAVESYLRDRGVVPGHGLLDIYSAINAGAPGRYTATDANNGGAPGTVADKVAQQMWGHRQRANALLGAEPGATPPAGTSPIAARSSALPPTLPAAPSSAMSAPAGGDLPDGQQDQLLSALRAATEGAAHDQPLQAAQMPAIQYPSPPGLVRARALARAMSARAIR